MNNAVFTVALGLVPVFLLLTAVYAAAIKIIAPQLTVVQCLLTSVASTVAGSALILSLYLFLKPVLQESVQTFGYILCYLTFGWVITRLARNFGVEKEGWLGVGGKANLWLVLWVVAGVFLVRNSFAPT